VTVSVKGDDADMGQDGTPQIPGTPVPGPSIPGTPVPGPSIPGTPVPGPAGSNPASGDIANTRRTLPTLFSDPLFGTVAPGTGAGSGGKFSIDVEQMQAELPKWQQLLDDLKADYFNGTRMSGIEVPGGSKDSISSPYISNANLAGQAFLQHNRQMQDFVSSYIAKIQTALGIHVQTEQENVNQLNRQGD
jgi:hypothetical protein